MDPILCKSLIGATLISIANSMGAASPNAPILAQAGCCLERASLGSPWVVTDLSFEQCRAINEVKDNDNLLMEAGTIWWDSTC